MPSKEQHSRTGYVKGCRCEICVKANANYQREYMREYRMRKRNEELERKRTEVSQGSSPRYV